MPVLKASDVLDPKHAYSGMRIPVMSQPIDNCPQCGSGGYRDGICANAGCNYLDPKVQNAYNSYSQSVAVQQGAMNDSNTDKGAKQASADGQTPVAIIDQFSSNSEKVEKEKCNVCKNTSIVDGTCTTQGCYGTLPPKAFRTPEVNFTGINIKDIPNKGPIFPDSAEKVFNSKKETTKSKKKKKPRIKTQATINRILAAQQQPVIDPGAFLDSSMILPKQPATRMREALEVDAAMQTQKKLDDATGNSDKNKTDKNNSEELQ